MRTPTAESIIEVTIGGPSAVGGGNRLHGEIGPPSAWGLRRPRPRCRWRSPDGDRRPCAPTRRRPPGPATRTDRGDLVDAGRWFLADRNVERCQPVQDLQRLVGTPTAVGIESKLDLVADRARRLHERDVLLDTAVRNLQLDGLDAVGDRQIDVGQRRETSAAPMVALTATRSSGSGARCAASDSPASWASTSAAAPASAARPRARRRACRARRRSCPHRGEAPPCRPGREAIRTPAPTTPASGRGRPNRSCRGRRVARGRPGGWRRSHARWPSVIAGVVRRGSDRDSCPPDRATDRLGHCGGSSRWAA